MTGCATNNRALIEAAERDKAAAVTVKEVVEVAKKLPALPPDCRKLEAHGVKAGDRLDAATLKAVRALGRANGRVRRCADWYDAYRKGQAL